MIVLIENLRIKFSLLNSSLSWKISHQNQLSTQILFETHHFFFEFLMWVRVILDEKPTGSGGIRVQKMGEQRHKHKIRDQRQQKWVQGRGSERGNEAQLR